MTPPTRKPWYVDAKRFETFDAANAYARKKCKRDGAPQKICMQRFTSSGQLCGALHVATARRDIDLKVWTDLTWEGSHIV